jgi:HEAT repeat protein
MAGHRGDSVEARKALESPESDIRAAALAALHRCGALTAEQLTKAFADPAPSVRVRAAELVAAFPEVTPAPLLRDPEWEVVEMAAWACGEHERPDEDVIARLSELARGHDEPLVREAAVAALGAIGDERGLPAILAGTHDKPAIRRRAVLALAPFEGPDVAEALARATSDRDWQVRQAAEDLLDEHR